MFRRLLLGIDDSPSGEVAVDFTTALAQRCSASVHVLFVNEYLVGGHSISLLTKDEATEPLTSAVRQLRDAGIHATGSSVVDSYRRVAARFAAAAREQDADAIVLGSHRRRRFGRLFSTQVREQASRLTELPVLIAPSPLAVLTRGRAPSIGLSVGLQDFAKSSSQPASAAEESFSHPTTRDQPRIIPRTDPPSEVAGLTYASSEVAGLTYASLRLLPNAAGDVGYGHRP